MTDVSTAAYESIGELKARCESLEAKVAALTAFACTMLEHSPSRDMLQTRLVVTHLGAALAELGPDLGHAGTTAAASVPAWIDHYLRS